MLISEAELGDRVFINSLELTGIIVGERVICQKNNIKQFCVGFNEKPKQTIGWILKDHAFKETIYKEIWHPEAYNKVFGYWVFHTVPCILLTQTNKSIIDDKQICIECKISAPHAKSNLKNNKFICASCIILNEIL